MLGLVVLLSSIFIGSTESALDVVSLTLRAAIGTVLILIGAYQATFSGRFADPSEAIKPDYVYYVLSKKDRECVILGEDAFEPGKKKRLAFNWHSMFRNIQEGQYVVFTKTSGKLIVRVLQ